MTHNPELNAHLHGDDLVGILNKWADVLEIPSGEFVNEDLRRAANRISELEADLSIRHHGAVKDKEVRAICADLREAAWSDPTKLLYKGVVDYRVAAAGLIEAQEREIEALSALVSASKEPSV